MEIDLFFTFFTGIFCDYDGADGDQCFDLANAYSRWIGGARFTGATADLIFNQPGDFYTAIPNTPDGIPQKGDIIVWNWPHVGIATGNNSSTSQFEVLEQNDPANSNCHVKVYLNYNGVLGWLRPKTLPQSQQAVIDQLRTERDSNWNKYQDELKKNNDLTTEATTINEKLTTLQTDYDAYKATRQDNTVQSPTNDPTVDTLPPQLPTENQTPVPTAETVTPPKETIIISPIDAPINNSAAANSSNNWFSSFWTWLFH